MPDPTNTTEDKADRFKRVANTRLSNVLKAIETLEKCADRNTYEYSQAQMETMFKHIDDHVDKLKQSFSQGKVVKQATGSLL